MVFPPESRRCDLRAKIPSVLPIAEAQADAAFTRYDAFHTLIERRDVEHFLGTQGVTENPNALRIHRRQGLNKINRPDAIPSHPGQAGPTRMPLLHAVHIGQIKRRPGFSRRFARKFVPQETPRTQYDVAVFHQLHRLLALGLRP